MKQTAAPSGKTSDAAKQCRRCVHTETYPRISFDAEGICNYCRYHEKFADCSVEQLEPLFAKVRAKGKYDCLVPVSGGLDSTYVLYLVTKKFKLKPLAFNFDNGWQHPMARKNLETITQRLGVELRVAHLDWDILKQMYLAFIKAGVPEICGPCMVGIYSFMLKIADQENISLIINGSSITRQGSQPLNMFYVRDGRYFNDVLKKHAPEVCKHNYCRLTLPDYFRYFVLKGIKIIPLPEYIKDWDDATIAASLRQELGWDFPENTLHRFDCLMYPLMLYWTNKKFNWNPVEMKLAALVRSKEVEKDKALEMLMKEPEEPTESLEKVLQALGLSRAEFDKLFTAEPRTFKQYKNYYSLLTKFRPLIKLLTKMGFVQSMVYDYYFTH